MVFSELLATMRIFYQYIYFNKKTFIGQFSTYLLNIADAFRSIGAVARFSRTFEPCLCCGDAQKYPYHQPSLAADHHSVLSKSKRRQFLGGDPANSSSAVVVYAAVVQMWAVGDRSFLLYSAR